MLKSAKTKTIAPKAKVQTKTSKGARTREALKAAAQKVLEAKPYHEVRIADITNEAGVATGLYYHYFGDLKTLLIELVEDVVEDIQGVEEDAENRRRDDIYGRLYDHIRVVVEAFMKHPGLMRALAQMSSETPELAALWRQSTARRIGFLIANFERIYPDMKVDEKAKFFFSYATSGLGDLLLHEYFIHKLDDVRQFDTSVDELTELIALMYYRTLFAANPPADRLNNWADLAAGTINPITVQGG